MKVAITGATGLIGRNLTVTLTQAGHEVYALTRNGQNARLRLPTASRIIHWQPDGGEWENEIADCDAVVNLAGENLSSGRWTEKKKALLLDSRTDAIRSIGRALPRQSGRRTTVIQSSAVGYYGPQDDERLSEEAPSGSGYLAHIARACEREADLLGERAARVVSIRSGIVLSREAGILPRLFTPLRLGFGGFPGHGRQWLSWIHIDDEVGAIRFLLEHTELSGAFNLTAPEPIPVRELVRVGGQLLRRPVWVPLPAFVLRMMFGEMADEALLTGQRVVPSRLQAAGFSFRYATARAALEALYSRQGSSKDSQS